MLSEVQKQLKRLYLTKVIDTLPSRVSQAHADALSHLEWLQLILQDEIEHRNSQSLQKRLQRACFEQECTFINYHLSHYPVNIQRLINDLRNGDYLVHHNHVLIMGPTGTGKTHLAQALGHQACIQEYDVQFIRANKLLEELDLDRSIDASTQRLKKYLKPRLLIIDDFGLRSLSANQANDLYELVVAKERKSSFIITSNKPVEAWVELFPDPVVANAILDRVSHSAYHLILSGESYRRQLAIDLKCPKN